MNAGKRMLDISLAAILLLVLSPLLLALALLVRASSKGPALYWSRRIGRGNIGFQMPKFRSMRPGTPQLPTHLLVEPARFLTPVGSFLRRSSLDELPQLWSILRGDLSFVGPRPALFNQYDLVALREGLGVHQLTPGLTGWAQVNGRDELSIAAKVALDREYMTRRSFGFDCRILLLTLWRAARSEGVRH